MAITKLIEKLKIIVILSYGNHRSKIATVLYTMVNNN